MNSIIVNWRNALSSGSCYEQKLMNVEPLFAVNCVASYVAKLQAILVNKNSQLSLTKILRQASARRSIGQDRSGFRAARPIPPGTVDARSETPRHDNDFLSIASISVMPTMEEILSTHSPALPGNHFFDANAHWLPSGPNRLLDTHFRLLREDMLSSLRSGVNSILSALREKGAIGGGRYKEAQANSVGGDPLKSPDFDLFVYKNVSVEAFSLDARHGLCLDLVFEPPSLSGSRRRNLKEFWEGGHRLENGILLCLLLNSNTAWNGGGRNYDLVFGVVVNRSLKALEECKVRMALSGFDLPSEVIARLISSGEAHSPKRGLGNYLVEASKVLYEVYRPILESLQRMDPGLLPFQKYLCPSTIPQSRLTVDSPLYTLAPGFKFDLSFLIADRAGRRETACSLEVGSELSAYSCRRKLLEFSTLDEGQIDALIAALRSEIAFIQGPPGTGKSYVGVQIVRAIVAATSQRNVGPIFVLCYTNHALDQFLNHLLDVGIDGVVRIGKRSSDARIASHELDTLTGRDYTTLKRSLWAAHQEKDDILRQFLLAKEEFETKLTWPRIKAYLIDRYFDLYQSFAELEEQEFGWVHQGRGKKKTSDLYNRWQKGLYCREQRSSARRSIRELLQLDNVWDTTIDERRSLHEHFAMEIHADVGKRLKVLATNLNDIARQISDLHDEDKLGVLRDATVIGATTTGAAKKQKLIMKARPQIIICEEAGEVLESHILANLAPTVKQMIQIGDHLQLRPQIAQYDLSVESRVGSSYALDMSMFERMQNSQFNFPLYSLDVQRRMRPEISTLIRQTLYPQLKDSDSVQRYPDVLGVDGNLFFFDHDNREDLVGRDTKSHSNDFEVGFIVALTQYLLQQGFKTSEVTILTPYLGQLAKIRRALGKITMVVLDERDKKELDTLALGDDENEADARVEVEGLINMKLNEGIRVSTIDNYQGEESKIILISLPVQKIVLGIASIAAFATCLAAHLAAGCRAIYGAKTGFHVATNAPPYAVNRAQTKAIVRYGRVIKRAAIDAAEKNHVLEIDSRLKSMAIKIKEQTLKGTNIELDLRLESLNVEREKKKDKDVLHMLKRPYELLIRKADELCKFAVKSPCRVVYESSFAKLLEKGVENPETELTMATPPSRFVGQAELLQAQCFLLLAERYHLYLKGMPNASKEINEKGIARELVKEVVRLHLSARRSSRLAFETFSKSRNGPLACQALFQDLKCFESLARFAITFRGKTVAEWLKLKADRETPEKQVIAHLVSEVKGFLEDDLLLLLSSKSFMHIHGTEVGNLREWFSGFIKDPVAAVRGELSTEELISVFKAMSVEFNGSGHWYRCPQGHMYTIGECGMAMQASHCPECGERIGGGGHRLDSTNSHASDFERRMQSLAS
ncbi:hypothetical protein HDU96_000021 [Phlyctochytrium bullatum]|nr:hypothetical protein HDU96_000021 [Phlyctochytrium bullatum]